MIIWEASALLSGQAGEQGGGFLSDFFANFTLNGPNTALVVIVVGVVALCLSARSRRAQLAEEARRDDRAKPDADSLERLKEHDAAFDTDAMAAQVRQWAAALEQARNAGDMNACAEWMTEALLQANQADIDTLEKKSEAMKAESTAVPACVVEAWRGGKEGEELDLWLAEEKHAWKEESNTPEHILLGDRNAVYRMVYRWRLTRPNKDAPWRLAKVFKLSQNQVKETER